LSLGNQVFDLLKGEAGVVYEARVPKLVPQLFIVTTPTSQRWCSDKLVAVSAPREGSDVVCAIRKPPLVGAAVRISRFSSARKPGEPKLGITLVSLVPPQTRQTGRPPAFESAACGKGAPGEDRLDVCLSEHCVNNIS